MQCFGLEGKVYVDMNTTLSAIQWGSPPPYKSVFFWDCLASLMQSRRNMHLMQIVSQHTCSKVLYCLQIEELHCHPG